MGKTTEILWSASVQKIQDNIDKFRFLHLLNCPIDIEVRSKDTGDVVCRIADNVVDEEIAEKPNALLAYVIGETKYIYTEQDKEYVFTITGNGNGTMNYSVIQNGADLLETSRVNFFDVPITPGTTLTGSLGSIRYGFTLNDYILTGTQEITPTENFDNASIRRKIQIYSEGKGIVPKSIEITSGNLAHLCALPDDNNTFLGWYENGALVSADADYAFVAKTDRDLTAKFTNNTPPAGRVRSVTADSMTLLYKKDAVLTPSVTVDSGVKYTVGYSGFDSRIISVDASGKVTALKKGTTNVTVTATDEHGNTAECTCKVTVKYAWWQILIRIFLLGFIWY